MELKKVVCRGYEIFFLCYRTKHFGVLVFFVPVLVC